MTRDVESELWGRRSCRLPFWISTILLFPLTRPNRTRLTSRDHKEAVLKFPAGRYVAALCALLTLPIQAADPLYFIQASDPQFGMFAADKDFTQETANWTFAIANINRLHPAFLVVTGDLVNKTEDPAQIAEYKRINRALDPAIHIFTASQATTT